MPNVPYFWDPYLYMAVQIHKYTTFFGHLAEKFMDCDQNMLTLGFDDKQAMRKAMINFFPSAQTVAYSKHSQHMLAL
jgi:hypothetical protein